MANDVYYYLTNIINFHIKNLKGILSDYWKEYNHGKSF